MQALGAISRLAICLVTLAGCANSGASPLHHTIPQGIDRSAAAVEGRAFLVSKSGKTRNCHGDDIRLIAVTPYTSERLARAFAGKPYASRIAVDGSIKDSELEPFQRRAACDRDGKFHFEHVASGEYFILAKVYWSERWGWYGGGVLQALTVDTTGKTSVELTHTFGKRD